MVKMSEHEEFLTAGMVKTGDVLKILEEGRFLAADELEEIYGASSFGRRTAFFIDVELPSGTSKTWVMNKTTRRRLAAAYGDDSVNWIGRNVRVEVVKQNVRGQLRDVIYGHPTDNEQTPPQKKLTESEVVGLFKGATDEEKKKYIETLKTAGLLE